MSKTYKLRELIKALREYDKRFEVWNVRGKGSHITIYHPDVEGQEKAYTLPSRDDVLDCYILRIIDRFKVPPEILGKKSRKPKR